MQIERLETLTSRLEDEARSADYIKWLMANGAARGDPMAAGGIFANRWPNAKNAATIRKAAAAAVNTTGGAPLVELRPLSDAFLDAARPRSILGRLQGFRPVPANVKIPSQTSAAAVGWVGEGAPAPVAAPAFAPMTLPPFALSAIIVVTDELVRSSNPAAAELIRADLEKAIAAREDVALLDPTAAAVANVSPASITNGVTPTASTGSTAAAIAADLAALLTALGDTASPYLVMKPATAISIAKIGGSAFPDVGPTGGAIWGVPVLTSSSAPAGAIVAIDTAGMAVADDGLNLEYSTGGSVQMDSAPTNPSTAATVLVSLWQTNLVAYKATRFLNWAARPGSVALLAGVSY